ncbi:hypothetical protein P280DRAFT_523902 [Massarina eburnea CBS 473.64]|uniref:Uncharacterized protein n=1 Tax=Massarina eburnea CBS 473.64 TaxID=1395130 RepID=A0A6A6RHB3_9PLEO|nr:hypothetical protein P280DRAFT_523902 [Massarina eburnea CBS 473.64]
MAAPDPPQPRCGGQSIQNPSGSGTQNSPRHPPLRDQPASPPSGTAILSHKNGHVVQLSPAMAHWLGEKQNEGHWNAEARSQSSFI